MMCERCGHEREAGYHCSPCLSEENANLRARVKELEEAPLNLPGAVEAKKAIEEARRLNLQIRELCGALVARRAMEPQHSREDHTCKECELVAEIIHSERSDESCKHEWLWGTMVCAKCKKIDTRYA